MMVLSMKIYSRWIIIKERVNIYCMMVLSMKIYSRWIRIKNKNEHLLHGGSVRCRSIVDVDLEKKHDGWQDEDGSENARNGKKMLI